jgi:phytoene dehydrogenase-like protein
MRRAVARRSGGATLGPLPAGRPRRVLVMGGGHNGLVAGVRLARAGCEVVVFEHEERPGGAVKSANDTLPGFVHDRCAGFLALTAASPAFAGLDVRERLEWVIRPSRWRIRSWMTRRSRCTATWRRRVASLEDVASGAGRAWEGLVGPLLHDPETLLRAALSPLPPLAPGAALAVRLRRDGIELARRMLGSAASFGGMSSAMSAPRPGCAARRPAPIQPRLGRRRRVRVL